MTNKQTAEDISVFSDIESIIGEVYTIAKDGYKKGLQVGKAQLAPLNVKVETALIGKNLSPEKLKRLKDLNRKYIEDWRDKLQGKIYDLVYDGLEKGKTIKQITDDIMAISDKSILEAKRVANDIIIDAARRGEVELFKEMGIDLYRDIAIVDEKTCGVCLGLNGRIYHDDPIGRGLVNNDNGSFITDEITELAAQEGLEDWIVPEEGKEGPSYHSNCRCMMAPVLTFEQYKGAVQTTISEV